MKTSALLLATFSLLPALSLAQVGGVGGGVVPPAELGPQPTTVWVTKTDAAGVVVTQPALYTQTFRDPPPMVAVKQGEIGLGQWGNGGQARVTGRDVGGEHQAHHAKKTALPAVDRHHKRCSHGHCH